MKRLSASVWSSLVATLLLVGSSFAADPLKNPDAVAKTEAEMKSYTQLIPGT